MRKRKKLWVALTLILVLCTAWSSVSQAATEEQTEGTTRTFILGLDDSFPPMGYRDENNEIVGFDIDLAREVCKRLNWELKLQPISWNAKEQELKTEAIDCIWNGLSVSPERQEQMLLSDSYMTNNQVAVVLADSDMNSLDDLAGKQVVAQNGSTASEAIDDNQEFKDSLGEVILLEDNVQAMLDLATSGSDAVIMDEVVARYYMKQHEGEYKILDGVLAEEEYAIAFRKDDTETCDAVNQTLKEMEEDGTIAEISSRWFETDADSEATDTGSSKGGMSTEAIGKLFKLMLTAALESLKVFFFTLLIGLPLGLLACVGRMTKVWIVNIPVKLYLVIMRGTPLILQLMFWKFAPYYIIGKNMDIMTAAIVAFSLNYAAYFAEIYRSGIEGIPVGQKEAATVLGFSKLQTFFKIVMPQVIKRILPPMSNEFMTLVKDTSLAQVIGVAELYQLATKNMAREASVIPLIMAGVFYLVMNIIVQQCFNLAERKLRYYR